MQLRDAVVQEQILLLDAASRKFLHCLGQLDDEQLWWRPAPPLNSVANLVLHVCGNLTQWILCGVRGDEDLRQRAAEFEATDGHTAEELNRVLTSTLDEVRNSIRAATTEQLLANRIIQSFEVTGLGAIVHSVTHFVGHTHQVIQLTRLQLGDSYRFEWTPDADQSDLPI